MGILFDQIGDRRFWEVFHVHLDVQKSSEHLDRPWELISLIDDCLRGVKHAYISIWKSCDVFFCFSSTVFTVKTTARKTMVSQIFSVGWTIWYVENKPLKMEIIPTYSGICLFLAILHVHMEPW